MTLARVEAVVWERKDQIRHTITTITIIYLITSDEEEDTL